MIDVNVWDKLANQFRVNKSKYLLDSVNPQASKPPVPGYLAIDQAIHMFHPKALEIPQDVNRL